jgi:hypothetical protein
MNYEETVKKAAGDTSHQWLVFTVVAVIFSALSLLETAGVSVKSLGSYVYRHINIFPYSILGFFATASVIFAVATALFVISKVYKTNITYINALNITTAAYLPVLFGTTLNFIFIPLTSVITSLISVAAHLMFFALICVGVRKVVPEGKSPFWAFSVAMTVAVIAVAVIVTLLTLITTGASALSLMSSLSNLF